MEKETMIQSPIVLLFFLATSEAFLCPTRSSTSRCTTRGDVRGSKRIEPWLGEKREGFDFDGFSARLRAAYQEWCQTYKEKIDASRMEIFSYHFMVAENYYRRTGVKVKLNEYAGLTDAELEQSARTRMHQEMNEEKPPSAEFLDLADKESSYSNKRALLYSHDYMGNSFSEEAPFYGSSVTDIYRDDSISISTNAYLESASQDSIVPLHTTRDKAASADEEGDADRIEESIAFSSDIQVESSDSLAEKTDHPDFPDENLLGNEDKEVISSLDTMNEFSGWNEAESPTQELESDSNAWMPEGPDSEASNPSPRQYDMDPTPNDRFDPVEAYYVTLEEEILPKTTDSNESISATPLAVAAAKEANIDLSSIQGTGRKGRITLGDIEAVAEPCEEPHMDKDLVDGGPTIQADETTSPQVPSIADASETVSASASCENGAVPTSELLENVEIPVLFDSAIAMETAQRTNIDVRGIHGTGQLGRLTLEDVHAAIQRETKQRIENQSLEYGATAASWWMDPPEASQVMEEHLPDWVVGNAPSLAPSNIASKIPMVPDFDLEDDAFHGPLEATTAEDVENQMDDFVAAPEIPPNFVNEVAISGETNDADLKAHTQLESTESSWYPDVVSNEYVDGLQVTLPELTFWMREAKVLRWLKRVGDPVRAGETLLVVECDTRISKRTQEYAESQLVVAPEDGYLVAVYFKQGEMISVGQTVGVISASVDGTSTKNPSEPSFREMPYRGDNGSSAYNEETTSFIEEPPLDSQAHQGPVKPTPSKSKVKTASERSTTPMVQWESKGVQGNALNHVMVPFFQKKLEGQSQFRLPAFSSSQDSARKIHDKKTGLVVCWESSQPKKLEKPKKSPKHHPSRSLPEFAGNTKNPSYRQGHKNREKKPFSTWQQLLLQVIAI
eukprot:scaffold6241_cov129-Cylindrotheca_fusiformis.AAC.11